MGLSQTFLTQTIKFFLCWVPMNPYKDLKAKLERAHFSKVWSYRITVCPHNIYKGSSMYHVIKILGFCYKIHILFYFDINIYGVNLQEWTIILFCLQIHSFINSWQRLCSGTFLKKETAVTRSTKLVIGTSISLRLLKAIRFNILTNWKICEIFLKFLKI